MPITCKIFIFQRIISYLVEEMVEASKLNGTQVITSNAFTLGEVEGAEIDTGRWQVTHLHISLAKEATEELGFKKPLMGSVKVCLPVTFVEAIGDVITLNKSFQELKDTEECKRK